MDDVRLIPTSDIREPRTLLRLVDRNAVEYLELRDSVAAIGFTNSIAVRPSRIELSKFEVLDGVHRYCVAKDLELPTMPCIIKHNVSDDDVLMFQVQANAQGVDTKPVE